MKNKNNLEEIADAASMRRTPIDAAQGLLNLYGSEAMWIAQGCLTTFKKGTKGSQYWEEVCDHLKPMITKH